MDLPVFRRGLELVSSQLNKLSSNLRASTITSVIGGTFSRTPGGTTLIIAQQPSSSTAAAAIDCPFKVTDISEANPQGGQLTLKLNVKCEQIRAYDDVWPMGTGDGQPNYVIVDIPHQVAWYGIYLVFELDQEGNLTDGDGHAVQPRIEWSTRWEASNSTDVWVYLAGVNVSSDEQNNFYFSYIENACPVITRPTIPACPFLVEESLRLSGSGLNIQIRSGKIQGVYPTGMDSLNTYSLQVPETSPYWYVYCNLVILNGIIQTGPDDITFSLETSLQTSTADLCHFLIAEFQTGYDTESTRVIEYLYNYCTVPFVTVTGGGGPCAFEVTDATIAGDPSTPRVLVKYGLVDNREPLGMDLGTPFYLSPQSNCWIYCKLTWNTTTMVLDDQASAIQIVLENQLKTNTATETYTLIAAVTVKDQVTKVDKIYNSCFAIVPDSCALNWSTA
jgi:hypothetical protein